MAPHHNAGFALGAVVVAGTSLASDAFVVLPIAWKINDCKDDRGSSEVRASLSSMRGRALADAAAGIQLLARYGPFLTEPDTLALGGALFELRCGSVHFFYVFRPHHRILLLTGVSADSYNLDAIRRARELQRQLPRARSNDGEFQNWLDGLLEDARRTVRRHRE